MEDGVAIRRGVVELLMVLGVVVGIDVRGCKYATLERMERRNRSCGRTSMNKNWKKY